MSENISNINQTEQEWKPRFSPWLIAFSVMLATVMEILDTSVANVALPHMSGTFSTTTQETLWVITSYIVANAVILPSTAWFSSFFGRKNFLITCIIIFTGASILCGFSNSLDMMIVARIIQGAGGGALMPISQAVLMESFPKEKRGQAMAIFGLGVITAPILGPILGGWITDNYSWQWIFFINVPIGILAVTCISMFIEDPPYIKANAPKKIDYIGFSALIVWLITLQIIFDKGQQANWFESDWVCWMAGISISAMIFFIVWELRFKDSIIDLKVLTDKNYSMGAVLSIVLGAILYGTLAILPMFLQTLLGYNAVLSGMSVAPRGIGSFMAMGVAGYLSDKIDYRIQIAFGFLLLGISNLLLSNVNLNVNQQNIILPNIISGVATSFIFIPLTTVAFSTLKNEQIGNATGLLSLFRNIGGGLGTSVVSTFLVRNAQIHQGYLIKNLNPFNHVFQQKLGAMQGYLALHMDPVTALHKANFLMYSQLLQQANFLSYVDNFRTFGFICLFFIPASFVFKKVKSGKMNKSSTSH